MDETAKGVSTMKMPYLSIDALNAGDVAVLEARELGELTDDQLDSALNRSQVVVRWNPDEELYERLEFINDLIPNWVALSQA